MKLFTLGPRFVQRLVTAWIVLSLVSASSALVGAQEAKAPPAKPTPEKKAAGPLTDPPLDGKFDELPYDGALKRDGSTVNRMLADGEIAKGQEAAFDAFFIKYSLGRWAQRENFSSLPVFRKELRSQLMTTFNKGPKAHAYLNALLLKQLPVMANGNYAPVVRINAVLMIGDLNSAETKPGASAVPLAAALEPLTKIAAADKQLESVKIAALAGLRRHAESGIAEGEARTALVALLVKLVSTANPPDRLPAGHDWMRGQAADVLGAIGQAGEKGDVAVALGQLVATSKASFASRRSAARALGRLDYAKVAALDTAPLSTALIRFTIDSCERAKRDVDAANDAAPVDVNRQLRSLVNAAKAGLTGADEKHKGVAGAAKDPAQQQLASAAADRVNKLAADLEARDVDKDKIVAAIEGAVSALTPLVEKAK